MKKFALVTGASSGIGASTANLFSSLGASVILVGRDARTLDSISAQLIGSCSLPKVRKCHSTQTHF